MTLFVTVEGAQAKCRNGILRVSPPKREDTKARKIEVMGGDAVPKTIEAAKKASA